MAAFSSSSLNASLKKILLLNQDTAMSKLWNLKEISSVDEFRTKVPLTTYNDYRPYIDRIANNGEQYLMTEEKVVQFAPSSGTTGRMKLLPLVESVMEKRTPPAPDPNAQVLLLFGAFPDVTIDPLTPSGLLIAPLSMNYYLRFLKNYPKNFFVPLEAYQLPFDTASYVQLVLGLKNISVTSIETIFIPNALKQIAILKTKHAQMIDDIRSGTLDPSDLSIPSDQRRTLEASMGGPDPARAHQLQQIFELAKKNKYKDVLSAVWPKLKVFLCGYRGNMCAYVPTLKYYTGPKIDIVSEVYACSEAGTLTKHTPEGLRLLPHNFYEFIHQSDCGKKDPSTLLENELQEGEVYELVLTLPTGFYRYRFGDLVKVIKQTETGPLIDLYGRTKMVLHLQDHTLYEMSMELVIATLTSKTPSRIDYTLSIDKTPSHNRYKVWMETDDADINQQTDLDKYIDEELQGIDSSYKEAREAGKIEQITVAMVKEGTFEDMLGFMRSKTLGVETQLKFPRVIIKEELSKILEENAIIITSL